MLTPSPNPNPSISQVESFKLCPSSTCYVWIRRSQFETCQNLNSNFKFPFPDFSLFSTKCSTIFSTKFSSWTPQLDSSALTLKKPTALMSFATFAADALQTRWTLFTFAASRAAMASAPKARERRGKSGSGSGENVDSMPWECRFCI